MGLAVDFGDVFELVFAVVGLGGAQYAPVEVKVVVAKFGGSQRGLGDPIRVFLAGLGVGEDCNVAVHVWLGLES